MTAKQIKEADADEAIERVRAEFNDDGFDSRAPLVDETLPDGSIVRIWDEEWAEN